MHARRVLGESRRVILVAALSLDANLIPMKTVVSGFPFLSGASIARTVGLAVFIAFEFGAATPPALAASAYAAYDGAVQTLYKTSLPDAAGAQQSLGQYRGKPVVVNFWASWCAPCVKEMPALSGLQRQYAKKGVAFVGIGVDSAKNVSQFLSKVKVDYSIYVAGFGGADLARQFGNNAGGLPFTIVIDKAGHVRYTKLGEIDPAALGATLNAL
jgi:thiol-disulfide isomerase/thioredoxin